MKKTVIENIVIGTCVVFAVLVSIAFFTYEKDVELESMQSEIEEIVPNVVSITLVMMDVEVVEAVVEEIIAAPVQSIQLTAEEMTMMYKMVEAEATGGDRAAKLNVAHVLINRVLSKRFPDTIKDVVFQKNQFSPLTDGRYYSIIVSESTIQAVNASLLEPDTTMGSTFFMYRRDSDSDNVTWFDENLDFMFKDSIGHEYFKIKGE